VSVLREEACIRLEGSCAATDAEPLLALLSAAPGLPVDLTGAGPLHTAVVQVLLACRPPLVGAPGDAFTAAWIVPALERARRDVPIWGIATNGI
jgi:hypothetical protein